MTGGGDLPKGETPMDCGGPAVISVFNGDDLLGRSPAQRSRYDDVFHITYMEEL